MKLTNINYKSIDDLNKNLNISTLNGDKTVIQVFSGLASEKEIKQIQAIIKNKNTNIPFIGSSTAGEIYEGAVFENTINVSIMEFEETTINQGFFIHEDDAELGKQLASTLFNEKTKVSILFIDGLTTNGNDVIDGISSINNTIPLAGGMAADNGQLVKTFIFDNNGVYAKGCVAISLDSDVLDVLTEYQLNWQPIGQTMTVTKAEKNRLFEINDITASDIYQKYLGKNVADNLPFSASEFPLLKIEKEGLEICRVCIARFEEDGSLLTVGNFEEGDKVRFAFGNIDLIVNSTQKNIEKYQSFQPEVIFAYNCTSRKSFLQSEVATELSPLNKIATNIGFFTYGEIFHKKNKNSLLSLSLTLLGLSESKNSNPRKTVANTYEQRKDKKNINTNKHFLILDALTHLTNSVILELEETKKKLKEQASKDYLTGLYNRRYFHKIAYDFMSLSKRKTKPFAVIMLDIDKFKNINDTYGHSAGDDIIKTLADLLSTFSRKSDIISRYGGEEFALLLPFTDKNNAYTVAEKIRVAVEKQKVHMNDGTTIQFTISLGVDQILNTDTSINQSIDRADKALYLAKNSGRNKVIMNES